MEPTRSAAPLAALCLAAAAALAQPAGDERPDQPAATAQRFILSGGALGCTTSNVTIRDESRDKDLELRVRTPAPAPGTETPADGWPLVVFSHGAGGSRDAFGELLEFWASHGYASVAMTHSDSIQLRRREGGEGPGALRTREGRERLRSSVDLPDRLADCKFVLDRLTDVSGAAVKAGGPPLSVDSSRIAIAGHSAGALTAQLCAGVRARGRGVGGRGMGLTSVGDDRFKAAIIISGQGTTTRLFTEDSWSQLKVPVFVIAGSLDGSPDGMGRETPESRRHPFELSRGTAKGGPPAYLLFIEGATHSSYSGKSTSTLLGEAPTTDVAQIQDSVAAGTTLFLDACLRDSAEARATLDSDRLRDSIPGKVAFERK